MGRTLHKFLGILAFITLTGCGVFEGGDDSPFILPLPTQTPTGGGSGGGGTGATCTRDSDCAATHKCNTTSGTCEARPPDGDLLCTKDADCPEGKACNTSTKACEEVPPDVSKCPPCPTGQICNEQTKRCEPPVDRCAGVVCTRGQVCNPATGTCVGDVVEDKCAGKTCPAGEICDPTTGDCREGKLCPLTFTGVLFLEMKSPPGGINPPDNRSQNIPLSCEAQEQVARAADVDQKAGCCCDCSTTPCTCPGGASPSPYPFDPALFCQETGTIPNPPSINEATITMILSSPNSQGDGTVTLRGADMGDFFIHDRTGNSAGDFIINGGAGVTAEAVNDPASLFNVQLSKDGFHLEQTEYHGSYHKNANDTIDFDIPFRFRARIFTANTNRNNNNGSFDIGSLVDDQIIPSVVDPTENVLHLITGEVPPRTRLDKATGEPTDETLGSRGSPWGPGRNVKLATAVNIPRALTNTVEAFSQLRNLIGGAVLVGRLEGRFNKTVQEFLTECRVALEGECDENRPCGTGLRCNLERKVCEPIVIDRCASVRCAADEQCNPATGACEPTGGGGRCTDITCPPGTNCNSTTGSCEAPPPPPQLMLKAVGDSCNGINGLVPMTAPPSDGFAREVTLKFCPSFAFYRDGTESGAASADSFTRTQTMTVRNESPSASLTVRYAGGTVGFFTIPAIPETTLASGQEARIPITFTPGLGGSTLVTGDTTKISQICAGTTTNVAAHETSLTLSSSPAVSLTIQACAKAPAPEILITELIGTSPFGSTDPPTVISGPIDFGRVILGQSSYRLLRIANAGVKNLGVNGLTLTRTGTHFQLSSVRQGSGFLSTESTSIAVSTARDSAGPFVSMLPNGTKDLFVRLKFNPVSGSDGTVYNATLNLTTDLLGTKTVSLTGSVTTDRTAVPQLWIRDDNDPRDADNPCNDPSSPSTTKTFRLSALSGDSSRHSLRRDTADKPLYVYNAKAGGDKLRVKSLTGSLRFAVTPVLLPLELNGGTCTQAGTVRFEPGSVNPDEMKQSTVGEGRRLAQGELKLESESVNTAGTATTLPHLTVGFKGVNGAPDGDYTLHVTRMMAALPQPLTTGSNRLPSTVTAGQTIRAGVGADKVEHFRIPVSFDAARGTITLPKVFTPTPIVEGSNLNNPPPPSQGIRLFNGPGASRFSTVFQFECLEESQVFCPYFYVYISEMRNAFTLQSPKPAIYTEYAPPERRGLLALDPRNSSEALAMQSGSTSLIDALGNSDPMTGEVTFSKNLVVRLFSNNMAIGTPPNNIADSTLPLSLSTECIGPSLVDETIGSEVDIQTLSELQRIDAIQSPSTSAHPGSYGPNPITPYAVLGACEANKKYLKGRRLFTSDTTNTLDRTLNTTDAEPDLGNLTFDLGGVARTRASLDIGHNKLMYLVIKACLEATPGNPNTAGAAVGGCNTCPAGAGDNSDDGICN